MVIFCCDFRVLKQALKEIFKRSGTFVFCGVKSCIQAHLKAFCLFFPHPTQILTMQSSIFLQIEPQTQQIAAKIYQTAPGIGRIFLPWPSVPVLN